MKLSKTNYLVWRDCAHDAWLKIHRRDLYNAIPLSAFDQTIIAGGNEVDELAREIFPGGVLIARGDAAGTAAQVAQQAAVLYQPVFETERFTTACDILAWNAASQAYDLYEVKASTSGEDKREKNDLYTYDIAFQAEVLKQNGVPLGRLHVVRLDADYVRAGALDLEALFTREDFSERVAAVAADVALEMDTAHDVLSSETPLPAPCACMLKGRSAHCRTFHITNPDVPEYSVHDIARIGASKKKLKDLLDRGILRIEDVPDDVPLNPAQKLQVRAAKSKQPAIDSSAIADFLAAIRYPVAFLDYETFAAAVPRFDGYGPYDHIPFQFSLDVVASPGAAFSHHEFLHTTPDRPDEAFVSALRAALPGQGTIVVWNQRFERGINDHLATRNPQFRDWLEDVDVRIVDLMEVFSLQTYVDPGFRGSCSIKAVLPVLVPAFSYKDLAIQDGGMASAQWNDMVTGKADAATAAKIRSELLAYCGLDSRAMLEIWRALLEVAEPQRRVG